MKTADILNDKTLKAKAKVQALGNALLDKSILVSEILKFAKSTTETNKATFLEAFEFATKQQPDIANRDVFEFATDSLTDSAPRLKWESAKVIGNIAYKFSEKLDKPITFLLANAEHEGTVVRWASAFALGEILKLKASYNKDLLPALEALCAREEDNGVKKKYLDAIKKAKK